MKSFFKTFFIIITLAISFLILPNNINTQESFENSFINNITQESVDLVSNNLYNAEITATQEENSQQSSGNSNQIVAFHTERNLLKDSTTLCNGEFIHNLSTNIRKVQPIRAP